MVFGLIKIREGLSKKLLKASEALQALSKMIYPGEKIILTEVSPLARLAAVNLVRVFLNCSDIEAVQKVKSLMNGGLPEIVLWEGPHRVNLPLDLVIEIEKARNNGVFIQ